MKLSKKLNLKLKFFLFIITTILVYTVYHLYLLSEQFVEREYYTDDFLCKYYTDLSSRTLNDAVSLDRNGVVMVNYQNVYSSALSTLEYNPSAIASFALRQYHLNCLDSDKHSLDFFWNQINWLVTNQTEQGIFPHNYSMRHNGHQLVSGWGSALTQGFAISALVRAYNVSNDKRYLNAAILALQPFETDVEDNGIRTDNEFGVWYEEYPSKEGSDHVLNGFLFGLYGLHDLYKFLDNDKAERLFSDGVHSVKQTLPLFANDYWSKYSLSQKSTLKNHFNLGSPSYQKLHADQLRVLYILTSDEIFKEYSEKIEKQYWTVFGLSIQVAYIYYRDLNRFKKFLVSLI